MGPLIVNIRDNGAWLFSVVSYLVHGNVTMASDISADNMWEVSNNKRRFKPSLNSILVLLIVLNVNTSSKYLNFTPMELLVNSRLQEIFPYVFEAFNGDTLLPIVGEALQEIKIIRITEDFNV